MSRPAVEDVPYRVVDGESLLGRLYRPAAAGPAPWVVDAHGGAWSSGDRLNNAVMHLALAARGIGVLALDFRLSDRARYPGPVEDARAGVAWLRANAARLGPRPRSIGGLGSSSGGQQMGLVALDPDGAAWARDGPGRGDARLDFLVACWPILDPLARYRMAKAEGKERLVAAHRAYFPDEAAMAEGNPYMLLERGAAANLPPVLILQGTADENVEHGRADLFAELYRRRGGRAEVVKFEGRQHAFVTADPDSEAARAAITRIGDFILAF